MIKKLLKTYFNGVVFGLGIFSIFLLIVGVYAFVEPSSAPTINNVMSQFSSAQASTTANSGMYDNRIPEGSFPNNYTEVCFKSGSTLNDSNTGGSSTTGGNCDPGDVGFIIEQDERSSSINWEDAKASCLQDDMRLPEAFEFKYACKNASSLNLNSMTGNWEWISNTIKSNFASLNGLVSGVSGLSGCNYGAMAVVSRSSGAEDAYAYRCAK